MKRSSFQPGDDRPWGARAGLRSVFLLVLAFFVVPWSAAPVVLGSTAPTLNGQALPTYNAPAGGLIAEIKKRGVILNGMEAQNPPFEYIENGKIVGYDVDLMQKLAEKLKVKAKNIDTAWSGVIPSLYTRKFDLIWSAMTITAPRKEAVTFSSPYASDQAVIIVRKGDTRIKSVKDLADKVVGTQLNSAAELQAKELQTKQGIKYKELKSYDHFDGAYLDLANGNIDAATSTKLNDLALFKNKPKTYDVAIELPIFNYVAVATRKPDRDLAKAVEDVLTEMKKSGELAKLQKKWFGYAMDLTPK
jgi:polar amino acid transport system substrate-binding protein